MGCRNMAGPSRIARSTATPRNAHRLPRTLAKKISAGPRGVVKMASQQPRSFSEVIDTAAAHSGRQGAHEADEEGDP